MENGKKNRKYRVAGGGIIGMSKEMPFIVFCIEEYRRQKKMTGKAVIELFNKYSVCEYVESFYEALHTTGPKYIVNDIDLYIASRQAV